MKENEGWQAGSYLRYDGQLSQGGDLALSTSCQQSAVDSSQLSAVSSCQQSAAVSSQQLSAVSSCQQSAVSSLLADSDQLLGSSYWWAVQIEQLDNFISDKIFSVCLSCVCVYPSGQRYPPGFWNGVEWRLLVEEFIPKRAKLSEHHLSFQSVIFE